MLVQYFVVIVNILHNSHKKCKNIRFPQFLGVLMSEGLKLSHVEIL